MSKHIQPQLFDTNQEIEWCPGCGNFNILKALKRAFTELEKKPEELLLCSGIGQAAKLPHYINSNIYNGLHGRALPIATAAKIVNSELTVIAIGGDGDMYGEGGNHFIHTIRRNPNITMIAHDNQIYGLTKGQASPTSNFGMITKLQKHGVINRPFNPLSVAIGLNCSFVSRGFAGNIEQLTSILKKAILHKGFALVDILQPCVTFNKLNTYKWYQERVYNLDDEGHDPHDQQEAFRKSLEFGDKIPTGIFYENKENYLNTYEQNVGVDDQALTKKSDDSRDITALMLEFT